MYLTMQTTSKKYAPSQGRAWWQRARPQFWIALALVSFLGLAVVYGTGRWLFRTQYPPLSVAHVQQDAATGTPTPSATPLFTATPNGYAPWAGQMNRLDNSQTQMSAQDKTTYKYDLPADVRAQLEADWKNLLDHYYTLPYWRWTDAALVEKYTIAGKLKAPTAGTPTATPVPMGATLEVAIPGKRTLTLNGCDATGTECQIVDVWSDVTAITYAYNGVTDKPVSSRHYPNDLAVSATLDWKDGVWKLKGAQMQVVQYATATPASKR